MPHRPMCPWPPAAEHLANDKIKERATKKGCTCCCKCCYSRQCVMNMYVYGIVAFGLACSFSIVMGLGFKTYRDSLAMLPTECTTISATYTGDTLSCNSCEQKRGGCPKSYPCLKLKVSYDAGGKAVNGSFLLTNFKALFDGNECLISDKECKSDDPTETLFELNQKFGTPGTTYDCFYHPEKVKEVMLEEFEIEGYAWGMLGAACGCLILAFFFICLPLIMCGCDYMWGCKPPPEIQEEVGKRQQQHVAQQQQQMQNQSQWGPAPPPGYNPGVENQGYGVELSSGFQNQNYQSGFNQQAPPPPGYTEATTGKF